jgi:hypothetical protein
MGCGASKIYPIVFNNTSSIDFKNDKCVICLEYFNENNNITLICGHSYHYDCILKWFEKDLKCPICKKKYVWTKDSQVLDYKH